MPRIDILMVGNEIFAKQLRLIHSLLVRTKDKHLKSNLHLELGIISRKRPVSLHSNLDRTTDTDGRHC